MLGLLWTGDATNRRAWGRRRTAVRKVCAGCERQRALFRYHGVVRWDRYHTLCFRCYRAYRNRLRVTGGAQA